MSLAELRKKSTTELKKVNKDDLINAIKENAFDVATEINAIKVGQDMAMQKLDSLITKLETIEADVRTLKQHKARLRKEIDQIGDEISNIRKSQQDRLNALEETMKKMTDENNTKFEKLTTIVNKQQNFLENIDQKERGRNLIIQGIPEGEDDIATIQNLLSTISGAQEQVASGKVKRLGKAEADKTRAILVEVSSVEKRNKLINQARECKAPTMKNIRVKKDLHPTVRSEWKRLFSVRDAETKKPENQGKSIHLDFKKREITCDGTVIDSWNPVF